MRNHTFYLTILSFLFWGLLIPLHLCGQGTSQQNAPKTDILNKQTTSTDTPNTTQKKPTKPYWEHVLKPNEQLHSISQFYGLSIQEIKSFNGLVGNKLDGLSSIKIPLAVQKSLKVKNKGKYVLHKAESNDKLHTLAQKYRTSLRLIKEINEGPTSLARSGDYILIPNTFDIISTSNRFSYNAHFSLGFFTGNAYREENETTYNIRCRFTAQNVLNTKKIRNHTRINTSLGYRHKLGDRFSKNIDYFNIRHQIEYRFKSNFAPYLLGSIRSQYLDTKYNLNGEDYILSTFFAPAYINFSAGFLYSNDVMAIDLGLYELKTIYVLRDKVYKGRDVVYGVAQGAKKFVLHGASVRMDLDYYKSEKFNIQSSFFAFLNPQFVSMDFRGELNYRMNKHFSMSFLSEVLYDNIIESDFQYRIEVLFGYSFFKN